MSSHSRIKCLMGDGASPTRKHHMEIPQNLLKKPVKTSVKCSFLPWFGSFGKYSLTLPQKTYFCNCQSGCHHSNQTLILFKILAITSKTTVIIISIKFLIKGLPVLFSAITGYSVVIWAHACLVFFVVLLENIYPAFPLYSRV